MLEGFWEGFGRPKWSNKLDFGCFGGYVNVCWGVVKGPLVYLALLTGCDHPLARSNPRLVVRSTLRLLTHDAEYMIIWGPCEILHLRRPVFSGFASMPERLVLVLLGRQAPSHGD